MVDQKRHQCRDHDKSKKPHHHINDQILCKSLTSLQFLTWTCLSMSMITWCRNFESDLMCFWRNYKKLKIFWTNSQTFLTAFQEQVISWKWDANLIHIYMKAHVQISFGNAEYMGMTGTEPLFSQGQPTAGYKRPQTVVEFHLVGQQTMQPKTCCQLKTNSKPHSHKLD